MPWAIFCPSGPRAPSPQPVGQFSRCLLQHTQVGETRGRDCPVTTVGLPITHSDVCLRTFLLLVTTDSELGLPRNCFYLGISPDILLFSMFCFVVLCKHCIFYKLKVCGDPASSKYIGTIFPRVCTHFVSVSLLVILAIFQMFSLSCLVCGSVIKDL